MIIIIGIIVLIIIVTVNGKENESVHTYNAHFGQISESDLSQYNEGFAISTLAFPRALSHTNALVVGPSGSGKSSIVTIPTAVALSRGKSSVIFNDPSGELWEHLSGFLAHEGYLTKRYEPCNFLQSETFNPLQNIRSITGVENFCSTLYENTQGNGKPNDFWANATLNCLNIFTRLLVFHYEPQYRTLYNLHRLISQFAIPSEAKKIDRLFLKVKETDADLLLQYKALLSTDPRLLSNIIANTKAAIHFMGNPEIQRTTASSSIDFTTLREKPVAIFCCSKLGDLESAKPALALFFQSLFNHVLSTPKKKGERDLFFVLDEFPIYKFKNIDITISNIRKTAGMMLVIQDLMSLQERYGEAVSHVIKTNCAIQCYLKGTPHKTCVELSQALGKYSYIDERGIARVRELLSVDEIRMMNAALVLVNNQPPLKIDEPRPYYKSFWLRQKLSHKPYQIPPKKAIDPPAIPFE